MQNPRFEEWLFSIWHRSSEFYVKQEISPRIFRYKREQIYDLSIANTREMSRSFRRRMEPFWLQALSFHTSELFIRTILRSYFYILDNFAKLFSCCNNETR